MKLPYHRDKKENNYKWHAWYLIIWYSFISFISVFTIYTLPNENNIEISQSLIVMYMILILFYTIYNIYTGIAFLKNNDKLFIISGMQFIFTIIVGTILVIATSVSKLYIYLAAVVIYYFIKIFIQYKINKTLYKKYIKENYRK